MDRGIIICGLGPGGTGQITEQTVELLFGERPVYLRTAVHPGVDTLIERGLLFTSFDELYESEKDFQSVYEKIVACLLQASKEKEIVYAVPGNPVCGEITVQRLIEECRKAAVPYRIIPAVSFVDICMAAVEVDPVDGLTILDALSLQTAYLNPQCAALITQVYNRHVAGETKLILGQYYPDETQVALISADETDGTETVRWMPLYEIDRSEGVDHLTTLFIPAQKENYRGLSALTEIMTALRAPGGCPWDRAQTHETLRTYLLEETFEAVNAIDHQDIDNLIEELGDILLQIVFHAEIGKESGFFDMGDVIEGICLKMIRRHPHVFGSEEALTPGDVNVLWEKVKAKEKGESRRSEAMQKIPSAFPALMRAVKIQDKARKDGFDWEDAPTAFPKIAEETAEVAEAMAAGDQAHLTEEIGDLLFAVSNVARLAGVDAELALKGACDKFVDRYTGMERLAAAEGKSLKDYDLAGLDQLWDNVKKDNEGK